MIRTVTKQYDDAAFIATVDDDGLPVNRPKLKATMPILIKFRPRLKRPSAGGLLSLAIAFILISVAAVAVLCS